MTIDEIISDLRARGCSIRASAVNRAGRFVHLVDPWDVAMFHEDISDVLSGRATLAEVVARNRGSDLADPWPAR
jgi:hypothetical protein